MSFVKTDTGSLKPKEFRTQKVPICVMINISLCQLLIECRTKTYLIELNVLPTLNRKLTQVSMN